jgi:hypothetical protein
MLAEEAAPEQEAPPQIEEPVSGQPESEVTDQAAPEQLEVSENGAPDIQAQTDKPSDYNQVLASHEQQFNDEQKAKKQQLRLYLTNESNVPKTYYNTSPKEELLLQYADNFNRQYTQLYPGRKELLLCPKNEFGHRVSWLTQKFVSNTIRPTQLPFKELYDYRSCATFVSEFITYEPLDPPHEIVF